ncbi:tetratricopeptide repeat protein [Balneolales bacterium ANBcel1]|nr:tetratricopeptide repeat protein [Balneolales bacterium ANBcel1]
MKAAHHVLIILLLLAGVAGSATVANGQFASPSEHHEFEEGMRLYHEGLFEQAAKYFRSYLDREVEQSLHEKALFHYKLSRMALDTLNRHTYVFRYLQQYPAGTYATQMLEDLAGRDFRAGRYEEALRHYSWAHEIELKEPRKIEFLFLKAESARQLELSDSSSTLFRILAESYPESEWAPRAMYARGSIYLEREDYEQSARVFEDLRSRYPNDPVTRQIGTALGEMYYRQGHYEEAIRVLRSELPYLEEEALLKAVLLIAESHNYLRQFDNAATQYRRYISLTDDVMQARPAHYGLGWVYHKQQVYHWAADAFEKASPGDDELARKALYYEAVNRKLSGRYDLALEVFQKFGDRFTDGFWIERAYYEWALTAFELGRNTLAVEVLQTLVRKDYDLEDPGKIYSLLGEAYFANNEFTRAVQAFEMAGAAADVDPEMKRQAQFQRAWVLYENHAYREAAQAFESVYREQPSGALAAEALFWSADSYFNLQQWQNATRQFERFVEGYPDHRFTGAAVYSLGWSYFHKQNFARAAEYFEAFEREHEPPPMALFPYDVDTRLRLGDSYFALGRYDDAIASYGRAAGADPGGDYAIFQIANSYYRSDRSFEAVSNFRRLARVFPSSRLREQAQYNIGHIFFQIGNYDQAIEEFHTLINRYPGTEWAARAQYQIGDAFFNAGDYERAVDAYRLVMDEYPQSGYVVDAVRGIQFAQLAAGKEDTSLEILESFLNQHPQTGTADQLRFRQAENLMQAGEYREAIASFRHYIRVTTTESMIPEAWFSVGEAYDLLGDSGSAISAYRQIVDEFPDSDRLDPALLHIGRLEYGRGRYEEAVTALERLVERDGRLQVEALAYLGDAYLATGSTGRADDAYDLALQRRSGFEPALIGKGRVAMERRQFMDAERYLGQVAESSTLENGAEAQYLLGRVQQYRGNYEQALDAYARVSALYEAYDRWVAEAMLATAETYRAMGQQGRSGQTLRDVMERFPDTEYAERAAEQL